MDRPESSLEPLLLSPPSPIHCADPVCSSGMKPLGVLVSHRILCFWRINTDFEVYLVFSQMTFTLFIPDFWEQTCTKDRHAPCHTQQLTFPCSFTIPISTDGLCPSGPVSWDSVLDMRTGTGAAISRTSSQALAGSLHPPAAWAWAALSQGREKPMFAAPTYGTFVMASSTRKFRTKN